MNKAPFAYKLSLADIDTASYPEAAKEVGSSAFRTHFQKQVEQEYKSLQGQLAVRFSENSVDVSWQSEENNADKKIIFELLQSGQINQAKPLLEQLLASSPTDTDALYNLGMIYSDQGQIPQAVELLIKATNEDPYHAHSLVALGVAYLRAKQPDQAERVLKKAHSLNSDDPYTLRTLAAIYMSRQEHAPAISMLRHSLSILPNDPISLLNLATTLLKTTQEKDAMEANEILTDLLNTQLTSEVEEKAKTLKRSLAYRTFRQHGSDKRSDAVKYCLDALKILEGLNEQEVGMVALEVAQKGDHGLEVNDPSTVYTIKSFDKPFTGLALVCLLHVAMQKVSPGSDSGFDVSHEYEEARAIYNQNQQP